MTISLRSLIVKATSEAGLHTSNMKPMHWLNFSPNTQVNMLQMGLHITQPADPLTRIPVAEAHKLIIRTDSPLAHKTAQLRQVMEIDTQAYRKNKTSLPYITAGIFHPPLRRTEHFAAAHVMIFDFDHFECYEALESAFTRLQADMRVCLMFRSPGGL